jgi:hypothetical protein
MSYQLEIDPKQLEKLTKVPDEIGKRAFKYLVQEIQAGFIDESPVDKGRLQKWKLKKVNDWEYKIHDGPEYALHVALGTGIYGKHKRPIVPVRAKMLRFKTKSGNIVFAKSVKGQKPNPYHERGVARGEKRVDEFIRRAQREVESGI